MVRALPHGRECCAHCEVIAVGSHCQGQPKTGDSQSLFPKMWLCVWATWPDTSLLSLPLPRFCRYLRHLCVRTFSNNEFIFLLLHWYHFWFVSTFGAPSITIFHPFNMHFLLFFAEMPDASNANALNTSIALITPQLQTKCVLSSEEIHWA